MFKSGLLRKFIGAVALAAVALSLPAEAQKIRVGYWPSGLTLGFGAVLEAGTFFKDQGLDVEYVKFSDVNGPSRAIAANAIDLAFGSPAAGAFSLISDGVPVKIILATQPANVDFVVAQDSGVESLGALKGKKIAMSPTGSSTAAIASAILAINYGIRPGDFSLVPGNEPRLVQFLAQREVDAAALRNVTVVQLTDLKVRKLASFAQEWAKITKTEGVPYNAVGLVRSDWLEKHPEGAVRAVVAMRKVLEFGHASPAAVVAAVAKAANLPMADAQVFADLWDQNYRVSLTASDLETLRKMVEIFRQGGLFKGDVPDSGFDTRPYEKSLNIK